MIHSRTFTKHKEESTVKKKVKTSVRYACSNSRIIFFLLTGCNHERLPSRERGRHVQQLPCWRRAVGCDGVPGGRRVDRHRDSHQVGGWVVLGPAAFTHHCEVGAPSFLPGIYTVCIFLFVYMYFVHTQTQLPPAPGRVERAGSAGTREGNVNILILFMHWHVCMCIAIDACVGIYIYVHTYTLYQHK